MQPIFYCRRAGPENNRQLRIPGNKLRIRIQWIGYDSDGEFAVLACVHSFQTVSFTKGKA